MLETGITILIVLASAAYLGRRWWREWSGRGGGCHGASGRRSTSRPQQITVGGRAVR